MNTSRVPNSSNAYLKLSLLVFTLSCPFLCWASRPLETSVTWLWDQVACEGQRMVLLLLIVDPVDHGHTDGGSDSCARIGQVLNGFGCPLYCLIFSLLINTDREVTNLQVKKVKLQWRLPTKNNKGFVHVFIS